MSDEEVDKDYIRVGPDSVDGSALVSGVGRRKGLVADVSDDLFSGGVVLGPGSSLAVRD